MTDQRSAWRRVLADWVQRTPTLALATGLLAGSLQATYGADYLVTIGGGYSPEGNQASLEANILFYQEVILEKHPGPFSHELFFADGHDNGADLQFVRSEAGSKLPATALLRALHRQDQPTLDYRNHNVPHVTGANDPDLIRRSLVSLSRRARAGDRVIIYVTAHGGSAKGEHPYNTSIYGWNDRSVKMAEFAGWLDKLPIDIDVLIVMAQCYCGGFGHTIFTSGDSSQGVARQLRAGFFAQRHDLPAAGCRPDIDDDEEFSSYFWGAFVGRSRTGEPMPNCDADRDGQISFAEAYANVMVASNTIDIPLRASEVFLRHVYETHQASADRQPPGNVSGSGDRGELKDPVDIDLPSAAENRIRAEQDDDTDESSGSEYARTDDVQPRSANDLSWMHGTLADFWEGERPPTRRIIGELSEQLGFKLIDRVEDIEQAYQEQRQRRRVARRGFERRGSSGRRDLLREVGDKWPELGDRESWAESNLLKPENQQQLFSELEQLPSYGVYNERRQERIERTAKTLQQEQREVKFRRLLHTLESTQLARRLADSGHQENITRYRAMIALEESTWDQRGAR